VPANASSFYATLMSIAAMEIVSTDDLFDRAYQLEDSEPFTPNFETMGYESMYSIRNFGLLYILASLCPLVLLLGYLANKLPFTWAKRLYYKIYNFYFWSAIVSFLQGSFLLMAMCAALNTKHFKFNSYGNACNSLFALLCIALIILMPLYVAYEYIKCILSLSDDSADEEEENEAAEQQEPGRLQRLQRHKDEFVLQYLLAPELQPDFLWFYLVV